MWNLVLQNFLCLKKKFIDTYGEQELWNYDNTTNCIEYWSSKFDDFYEMFSTLIINEFGDFVLLRYNLMDTDAEFWKKYDGMYKECRSIVLDKKNDCIALAPFRKFFNLNETEETAEKAIRDRIANAKRVEVSEKLDGSMQSARYYNGHILLAGTMALDASMSFRVAIGYSLLTNNYRKMLMDHPECTFIFELICKEDQHVVTYTNEQRGLYLIGVRNVDTGEQMSYADVIEMAERYQIKHTSVFDKTLDDLLADLDNKKSDEAEGFVIDIDGYKIKLKYNDYVAMHHMLKKLVSTNVVIRCVHNDTWDDVRSKMPEAYRADADLVANTVKTFIKTMENVVHAKFKDSVANYTHGDTAAEDRKNFVAYVFANHQQFASYIINAYQGKKNDYIRNKAGRFLRYHEIKSALLKLQP